MIDFPPLSPDSDAALVPAAPHVELSAKLRCPNPDCHRLVHEQDPVEGRTWATCVRCKTQWHVFVLPPGATGRDLAMMLGMRAASAVLRRIVPAAAELPDAILWEWALSAPDHAAYVQITVSGRERYLHRFKPVPALLTALKVV